MMVSDNWPSGNTMLPDLLRTTPEVRPVLDQYGLRGCGGRFGPAETIEFFSRAHDVQLSQLLDEIREAIQLRADTQPHSPAIADCTADTIYRPFFKAGIAVVLTLGGACGALLLLRIAWLGDFSALSIHEVNAHGHAQIFGWVGLFVMGFAYQAFPRFKHMSLSNPKLAYASFWMMLVGLVTRSIAQGLMNWAPWLGAVGILASVVEILAIGMMLFVILSTLRHSSRRLEAYDYYIMAALGWFFVQAVGGTAYFAATLLAADRHALLALVATWQAPLREIQIHGFATLMILGVSQRLFHFFYGLPRPNARKSFAVLSVFNAALVGMVLGFVLMRTSGHAWAGLWYLSILVLTTAVAYLVSDWKLFSPPEETDRSLKFLRTAYVWLFVSLLMLVLLPVHQLLILPWLAPQSSAATIGFSHAYYGAIRHAITVGFISFMIVGVAAKVVPTYYESGVSTDPELLGLSDS